MFKYLNLSHTRLRSLEWLQKNTVISRLDLRQTKLNFYDEDSKYLKHLKIQQAIHGDSFKLCCSKYAGSGVPAYNCFAPSDAISSCEHLIGDVIKRSLLWMIVTVGLVGNVILVVVNLSYKRAELSQSDKAYVTNLGVSDFLRSVYAVLILESDVYHGDYYVIYESQWRESSLCTAAGFLLTLSCETSTMFVLLITLDRYLIFKNPLRPCKIPLVGLVASVFAVWVIGLVLAILPVLYPEWEIYSSNGMCLGIPVNMKRSTGWTYSFVVFIVFNFLQLIFIIAGQIAIFKSIALSSDSQINSPTNRIREITVAKNLSLVVLSNFFCWFPVCVVGLMSASGHMFSPDTHGWLAICVIPLNSAVNPVLYTLPAVYQKWLNFYHGKLIAPREINNRNAGK
ncbi:G-protein coupled receptor GRL101-like [Physella acuta]|uniref:G-protein coupled receptor GRL101-like n=1 Tax=Physella acuta TaxID=109671 RepID=UPI0027DB7CEA|nr:G-protein coupled receptor GRL101-like [Physella acuta]